MGWTRYLDMAKKAIEAGYSADLAILVEGLKEKNPYKTFGNQESARHIAYARALDDVIDVLKR
jgi:hypothetical protein